MLTKLYVRAQTMSVRDDEGATAVEYGIMVALIAAIIVGVVATLGTRILAAFQTVVNAL
jgi:pilus assembly protein Flp/PilA